MEYAVTQAAAIALEGWEVHFLCKDSFPKERLAGGIVVEKFVEGRVASIQRRGLAGKLSTIWRLTLGQRRNAKSVAELATKLAQTSSTHHQLLTTSNYLGSPEVCVLFACYKEYFAPFWVWPLRRLAKKGVVIGTIAHDPVRDFVVGPLWWHRWSVRLAYSFVSHVFVHDDTPLDFGGKRPDRIQVHQIPHGPYEVAEPKIGRLEMRRSLGFLTTKCTNIHEIGKIIGSTEEEAGQRLAGQAGVTFSNPSTSELARNSKNTLPTRCASAPALALRADSMGSESAEGNQLTDSMEILEGQSQAGLQMDSQNHQSIRVANNPGASGENSSSVFIREIRGQKTSGAPEALYLATPASPDVVFLAFGQIRDGKNLDLFLRAMTILPNPVKLLVAGKGDSGSSKPPEFYQKLAEELGVADRCRWDIRRIPEDDVGDIFAACDVVLVTYSAKFRSASGVLNAAVSARKPVLASSGPGPLKKVVNKYHLGVFIEPDNFEEVLRGARQISDSLLRNSKVEPGNEGLNAIHQTRELHTLHSTLDSCFALANSDSTSDTSGVQLPAWEQYERENSWKVNANAVMNLISASNRNA